MAIGIDFGASNTVIASLLPEQQRVKLIDLGSMSLAYPESPEFAAALTPSLIHYGVDAALYGQEVVAAGLQGHPHTFRLMKPALMQRQDSPRIIRDHPIGMFKAAEDFLVRVLRRASKYVDLYQEPLAFTVPIEAFEAYQDWIDGICRGLEIKNYRLIDEASACLIGYEAPVQPGDLYLIVDFGAGALNISIVQVDTPGQTTRGCTVLGKRGAELGGSDIDRWLYDDILSRCGLTLAASSPEAVQLLSDCEYAKIFLAQGDAKTTIAYHGKNGRENLAIDQTTFKRLLEQHGLLQHLSATLDAALQSAFGPTPDVSGIKAVLLVGGTSLIPMIHDLLQTRFPDRVFGYHPLTAVAAGACRFAAGAQLVDHIQHDYVIRCYQATTGNYSYETLIPRGTRYPTEKNFKRFVLKGAVDGQTSMGLEIFEAAQALAAGLPMMRAETASGVHRSTLSENTDGDHRYVPLNPDRPLFLNCNPPCRAGEARFRLSFMVDALKRLLITAEDLHPAAQANRQRRFPLLDFPVVKLR